MFIQLWRPPFSNGGNHMHLSSSHCRTKASTHLPHLREERSLLSLLLQAVSHQSLHGLRTVAAHLTEVGRQVTSTHHKYDLRKEMVGVITICARREKQAVNIL